MKYLSSLLAVASVALTAGAVQPYYQVENASQLAVIDAVRTDSATAVRMMMVHHPNYWCSLDSITLLGHATGATYRPLSTDGYRFGEQKFMPESGRYEFTVNFGPVADVDSVVDVVEGGDMLFSQLHLDGKVPDTKCHTRIHGHIGVPASFVALMPSSPGRADKIIWIPVEDGGFNYLLHTDITMVYEVVEGQELIMSSYRSSPLFSENADVEVSFTYDDNGEIESVRTNADEGSLTAQLGGLKHRISELWRQSPERMHRDSLEANGLQYLPEVQALYNLVKAHPEKRDSIGHLLMDKTIEQMYTPEAIAAEEACRALSVRLDSLMLDEAGKMRTLAGLYLLISKAWYAKDKTPHLAAYLKNYAGLFPGHPYDDYFSLLAATNEPVVGNKFIDISAPDFDGKIHRLSEEIAGRPALIDLWASWCGPCRRLSESMIPVWEEFAPKGFTIVGVAREYRTADKAVKAIEADGYRWLNLLELDDAGHIWDLYRVSNAAGRTFLVDPDGTIVAVSPTAEEVRAYLTEFFK